MPNPDYLKVAVSAAKASAPIFKKYFGRPKDVKIKNGDPRDLVTEIDKKIETQIRKTLLQRFPKHKIIGEEFGSGEIKKNDLIWILDPVDGTTNYIQGLPLCCISIGLWDGQGPLVGVVYNPVLNYLFTAERGKGAFLNGKKIKVSNKRRLNSAFGGFGWGRNIDKAAVNFPKLVRLLHKIRTLGSATLEMCFCAMGVFDFHIQSEIYVWDIAAAALVVQEAGGRVSQLDGKNIGLKTRAIIASNGKIHRELLNDFKTSVLLS